MTVQSQNNKLSYLIDLTLTKGNRLFVSPFERIEENNVKKIDSFSRHYLPNVEIKDFNVLIYGKSFWKGYEKIIEMSANNDYATSNLLDFDFFW